MIKLYLRESRYGRILSRFAMVGLIAVICVLSAYLIAQEGIKGGIMVIGLAVAVVFALASFLFPAFGFYLTIVYAFLLFDIQRLVSVGVPLGTFVDILIFITFFGVLYQKYKAGESSLSYCRHPILFMYVVIILYSLIQFLNPLGAPIDHTLLLYRRFLSLLLFFYCAIQLFRTRKDIKRYLAVILTLCFFAGMYGCYQEWFGYPAYQMRYILSDPVRERLMSLDNGSYRKFSTFSSPTDFGIMMAGAALVSMVLLASLRIRLFCRIVLFTYMGVTMLAMSYSGTRTATFMLVMGVVLYVMMSIERRSTLVLSLLFSVGFLFIMFGPIYGNATINRLRSAFELSSEKSLEVRDQNRERIQPFIYANPLGGGLGTSGGNAVPGHPLANFPSDSGLLRAAIEYGWIGLLLECLVYFVLLQQGAISFYRSRYNVYQTFYLAATVAVFGYIVAQYAQVAIGMIPGSFLFYGLVAIIIRLRQMEPGDGMEV